LKKRKLTVRHFFQLFFLLFAHSDVKNLSDTSGIRAYQNSVLETFAQHAQERTPHIPFKVAHLLVRLAELSRISALAKEALAPRQQTGRIPHHSLLHELLKGDAELH
jgi:hypothetical protein